MIGLAFQVALFIFLVPIFVIILFWSFFRLTRFIRWGSHNLLVQSLALIFLLLGFLYIATGGKTSSAPITPTPTPDFCSKTADNEADQLRVTWCRSLSLSDDCTLPSEDQNKISNFKKIFIDKCHTASSSATF